MELPGCPFFVFGMGRSGEADLEDGGEGLVAHEARGADGRGVTRQSTPNANPAFPEQLSHLLRLRVVQGLE